MDKAEDELRPSAADIQRIYAESSQRWSSHVRKSHLQNGFAPESLRLRNMLGNIPSYLGHNLVAIKEQTNKPEFDLQKVTYWDGTSTLYVKGESSWKVGEGDCDLKEKIIPHRLLLGVQRSISCSFSSDDHYANWPQYDEYHMTQSGNGNCLAILIFAWSYILSARWVEIQQSPGISAAQLDDRMVYSYHQAGWIDDAMKSLPDTIDIYLGDVSNDAARWWAAILAKDEGWRAEIKRNNSVYRSPWSTTSISADHQFRLTRANTTQNLFNSLSSPPSSDVALGYMIDFCLLHNVSSQCSPALAAALTFPSLTKASLPLPSPHDSYIRTQVARANTSSPPRNFSTLPSETADERDEIFQDFRLLPYYMTLSCSNRGIESLLCNTFFDPHIPCNLVSAWIQPIFEVLDPLIAKKDYKVLGMVLGRQQPRFAVLWIGAIITGMARTTLQHCRNGLIAIDIHSAAWTNTTQTFMSLDPKPLPSFDRIDRSDECRLLYLAGEEELNARLPVCPWAPFGTTMLSDTDICVRTHAPCAAQHYLRYAGWSWVLGNGANIHDAGFYSDTTNQSVCTTVDNTVILDMHEKPTLVSETLSEMATRSIFGWLRGYGWPAAEKAIYSHSWILSESSDDESENDPEDDVSDPGKVKYTSDKFERIIAWLDKCAKESVGA